MLHMNDLFMETDVYAFVGVCMHIPYVYIMFWADAAMTAANMVPL